MNKDDRQQHWQHAVLQTERTGRPRHGDRVVAGHEPAVGVPGDRDAGEAEVEVGHGAVPEERARVAPAPGADDDAAPTGDEAAGRPPATVDHAEIDGLVVKLVEGDVHREVARDGHLAVRALAVAGERRLRERVRHRAERQLRAFDEGGGAFSGLAVEPGRRGLDAADAVPRTGDQCHLAGKVQIHGVPPLISSFRDGPQDQDRNP